MPGIQNQGINTMKTSRILLASTMGVFLGLSALSAGAQDSDANSINSDNTAVNMRDRNTSEATADQAKENLSDRQVMAKIRHAIIADKSLSTYGHNVKIISENGKVTLKGPVDSEAEHQRILKKATKIAGDG